MSYSFQNPDCGNCKKGDKCIDAQIIRGAINTIHDIGSLKGHLGWGNIAMTCSGFEGKEVLKG